MSKYVLTTVVFAVALFGLAAVASATVINVDYNASYSAAPQPYSGTAVAPDTGTIWNGVTVSTDWATTGATTSGALFDSFNNATPVTATISGFGGFYTSMGFGIAPALMGDWANTGGGTFTIDGLLPGNSYDLYLYAANGNYHSQVTVFTVGGTAQTVTNGGSTFAFVLGVNYALFEDAVADAGGTISGSTTGGAGAFNGLQVVGEVVVPEPSTIVLLATGLIGLLCYAWRKRKCAPR